MKFYGNGIVWDGENDRPLCEFVNGEFTTKDVRIIEILTDSGYVGEKCVDGTPFDNMSVEELKAYAEENGIDIGQSTSQKGILKKILEQAE